MKDYDLREIFTQLELDLIKSMKRALAFHEREEKDEGFKWEQWQLAKLRSLEKFRKNNQQIIDKYSKPIEKAIENTLNESFSTGQSRFTQIINRIKNIFHKKREATVNFPENAEPDTLFKKVSNKIFNQETQEAAFFGVNEKKLTALIEATTNDLKNGQAAMLRMADDVFRKTIYKSHVYLQSGAKTLNQAIDMATKDFLDNGFNCIQYKDGKRVNIASYAEMALRTASQRATFMGEGTKRDEWNIHLVVVSAHANTCKLCLPWQGKVLIDDVYSHPSQEYIQEYSKKYKLLSEAMKAGLLHPNCRHTLSTYFEGITQLTKVPNDKEALGNYVAEQKQRYYERQIRKWKRFHEGSCDPESQSKALDKVKEWQGKLKDHLKDNPQLRRDYERERNKLPTEKLLNQNTGNDKILSVKEPLAKRHKIDSIGGKKSVPKEKNTIILRNVDVSKDVQDIKNGLYKKDGEYYVVNGRKYGIHDSRLYPIEGDGFVTLDRNEYKLLLKIKDLGDDPKLDEILKRMGGTDEIISKLKGLLGGD